MKTQEQKLREIGDKFRKSMQKIVDSGEVDSITVSSPSFNDGKEVVVAEKKKK